MKDNSNIRVEDHGLVTTTAITRKSSGLDIMAQFGTCEKKKKSNLHLNFAMLSRTVNVPLPRGGSCAKHNECPVRCMLTKQEIGKKQRKNKVNKKSLTSKGPQRELITGASKRW